MDSSRQYQQGTKQYKMPKAVEKQKNEVYRVSYEATTGNNTNSGKKAKK